LKAIHQEEKNTTFILINTGLGIYTYQRKLFNKKANIKNISI